jgi:hypothetical protein
MDEYLALTLRSHPGEAEAAFATRIAAFWTHMLRTRPAEYEKVYAEATAFEHAGDSLTRQYLLEASALAVLTGELATAGLAHEPVDEDDLYSKYEAAPPDWFWIEH